MALIVGHIKSILSLDNSGFKKSLHESAGALSAFAPQVTAFITNPIVGATTAMAALGTVGVRELNRIAAEVESQDFFEQMTGFAPATQKTIETILGNAGRDAGAAAASMQFFNRQVGEARDGSSELVEAFGKLGVSLNSKQSIEETFRQTIDGLAQLEDRSLRAAMAQKLLGRSGGVELAAALSEGSAGLAAFEEKFRSMGLFVEGDGRIAMQKFDETMDEVGNTLEGFKTSAITELMAGLNGANGAARSTNELVIALRELGQTIEYVKSAADSGDGGFFTTLHDWDEQFERWWIKNVRPKLDIFGSMGHAINAMDRGIGGAKYLSADQLAEPGTEWLGITSGQDNERKRRRRARQ